MKHILNIRLLALALLLFPAATRAVADTFAGPPDTFYAIDVSGYKVYVRLNLMKAGRFTGTMDTVGGSHNVIKGTLDVSGSFSGTTIPSQTPYFITITGSTPSTYLLTGSTSGASLEGFPLAHVKGQAVAQQGLYTSYLVASSTVSAPLVGYATIRVTQAGATMLSGKLPDGTTFTAASNVVADGTSLYLAIFTDRTLYNKKGSLSGYLAFAPMSIAGEFLWEKPATKGPYYPAAFSAGVSV